VLDANGDGVFDRQDFRMTRGVHIDDGRTGPLISLSDPRVVRHPDGTLEIPGELRRAAPKKWFKGEELIELCSGSYLIDGIEPDGSALVFAKSELTVPRVGQRLPDLTLTTLDGRVLASKDFKGNVLLIDFWASWCGSCVAKFGAVKQIAAGSNGKLRVVAINVDKQKRLPAARQIIKKYGLTWPQVAMGRGENDPLWRAFGSMSNNGLSVPLYVLVNSDGIISYAGKGEEDLSELRAKILELIR
jgi:thiol-disulfide isomerase/thioredoxin